MKYHFLSDGHTRYRICHHFEMFAVEMCAMHISIANISEMALALEYTKVKMRIH